MERLHIRDARDDDEHGLIALIDSCFREYPGCVTDVDGEMPELRAIASHAARRRGRFWIAERAGAVVGSVGVVPAPGAAPDGGGMELIKLYVLASERGSGLGRRLVGLVEDEARQCGAPLLELWSDTRFTRAHRLYALLGFERSGRTRDLHDRSNTREYHFVKSMRA